MFAYENAGDPPKVNEIRLEKIYVSKYVTSTQIDSLWRAQWEEWMKLRCEIISEVICSDGIVFIVRGK